jgi:hypothetical protein
MHGRLCEDIGGCVVIRMDNFYTDISSLLQETCRDMKYLGLKSVAMCFCSPFPCEISFGNAHE